MIVSSGSENQIEDAEKAKKEGNEHFKAKRYEWINQSDYIYIYIYISHAISQRALML